MADILTTIVQSICFKKAALLEQWLAQHWQHIPPPVIEISNTNEITTARCGCGETISIRVVITLTSNVIKPKIMYGDRQGNISPA